MPVALDSIDGFVRGDQVWVWFRGQIVWGTVIGFTKDKQFLRVRLPGLKTPDTFRPSECGKFA